MKSTDTHVYFFGGVFSNFHPASFVSYGMEFNCSEQAYMWRKAIYFNDGYTAEKIMQSSNPLNQKKLGRKVRSFSQEEWDKVKFTIMRSCVIAKFSQNSELREKLISTGDKILVEASPYDKIWGVGLGEDDPLILDDTNWRGENLLGKVLMEVRENCKKL